jgi:hypothetical protein
MEYVTKDELLKSALKENGALRSQLAKAKSDIDYIAMMTEVDIDTEAEAEEVSGVE